MNNLLINLFAILDTGSWRLDQIVNWADDSILRVEHPQSWLLDLSISKSVEEALDVVREALKENQVVLPDDIGDLMAGLILVRFDKGQLSFNAAKRNIVDVVDAYGTGNIDTEAAIQLDLHDPVYSPLRNMGKQSLQDVETWGRAM